MRALFSTIYWLLFAGIIGIGLLLVASLVPVSGIGVKVVKSGSMEPAIHTGGIVVIKTESAYHVGDIVTFGADTKTQIPTTHRIVAISNDANPVYTTKGDANDAEDHSNTHLSDIHGKVIFTIGFVGYLLDFAKQPLGFLLLIGVPALVIVLDEVRKIILEVSDMRRKRKDRGGRGGPGQPTAPVTYSKPPPSSRERMDGIRMRTYAQAREFVHNPTVRKTSYVSSVAVLFIALAITTYMAPIGKTFSYFSDQELSLSNLFTATSVDIQLGHSSDRGDGLVYPIDNESADGYVDSATGEKMDFSFEVYPSADSAPFFYIGKGLFDDDAPAECTSLQLHAQMGSFAYDGPLNSFVSPATSTMGLWQFEISSPPGGPSFSANEECGASLVFYAEPTETDGILGGIFSDSQTYPLEIYNRGTKAPVVEAPADTPPADTPPVTPPVDPSSATDTPPTDTVTPDAPAPDSSSTTPDAPAPEGDGTSQ